MPNIQIPATIPQKEQLIVALLDLEQKTEESETILLNKKLLTQLFKLMRDKPGKFIKITRGYSNETYRFRFSLTFSETDQPSRTASVD